MSDFWTPLQIGLAQWIRHLASRTELEATWSAWDRWIIDWAHRVPSPQDMARGAIAYDEASAASLSELMRRHVARIREIEAAMSEDDFWEDEARAARLCAEHARRHRAVERELVSRGLPERARWPMPGWPA